MVPTRQLLLVVTALLLSLTAANAQEPIRFPRTPDISPDGKLVAFSYLGDVWVVETIGGVARPVTQHQAHDLAPAFSPDGKQIAFSSNRHGGYDVFVTSAQGGKPRRLTFDSSADMVCGWSPDGKSVLFASGRSPEYPAGPSLYAVPAEGGQERRVASYAKDGQFSPKGDRLAYVRGSGDWYRKGYRGSSSDDLWTCNADGSDHRPVSGHAGQDTSPMWSPDGQFLYFVSEFHGTPANIVRQDVAGQKSPQLVTFHKDDAVRKARLSASGEWIVYECGPDLFVVSTREGSSPRKLAIEVHADDKVNADKLVTYTQNATEFSLSPDEKHMTFCVHGELFLMALGASNSTRLTDSPALDHGFTWSPDGTRGVFLSDRLGHEDIFLLESDDPATTKITEAKKFKATPLTDTADAELGLYFSPDGNLITFLRAGKLWAMNKDGGNPRVLVNEQKVIDYEWSPDGKWIVYSRMDGHFASELYVMPAAGPTPQDPARNVTRYATFNAGVTWSNTGNKLAFLSQRRQNMGMYTLPLQKPAAPGVAAGNDFDWDDIHMRAELTAPMTAQEGAISRDGTKVAIRSGGSGDDLWVGAGGSLTRMTTGSVQPQQITWSKKFNDVIYFRDRIGQVRMVRAGADLPGLPSSSGTSGDKTVVVPFKAVMTVKQDEEFGEMLEQSWRALQENFYDTSFHGIDWHDVRKRYRPLVKHVAMKEDLYALVSLMMGELNASHVGIGGALTSVPDQTTADLGLIFDESHAGPGLKVKEVLARGPADKRGLGVKSGDLVLGVDGTDLDGKTSLSQLLNAKKGETVALQLLINPTADPKDPKARRRVEIQPTDRAAIHDLMYERWIANNAKRVGELTGGKVGYIHIPSMDEQGVDRFVRALYSDFDKEAIVLDVRFNGGGNTHDQILNYLGSKEHTVFKQRDGGVGMVLRADDRKWTKPLVLLINGQSYSDAEIFPSAFRTLGLGKLVGQPTGGQVIGRTSIRLIDGSTFLVPRIGVFTPQGQNMEKVAVAPDVPVQVLPEHLAKGTDPQLDKAVEVVLSDVAAWKKAQPTVATKPDEVKPPPTTPPGGMK